MFISIGHILLIFAFLILSQLLIGIFSNKFISKWTIIHTYNLYFLLITASIFCLFYSYLHSDFLGLTILENSNYNMPILYKICSLWGTHEGSIFFWVWVLSCYGLVFNFINPRISFFFVKKNFFIFSYILFFFISFTLATSNPFLFTERFFYKNGIELNPILQDPGLIIHPPFLYFGYLGYSILFVIGVTLLKTTHYNFLYWFQYIRLFNLIAWALLTFGIALGSWWAYHELGWGGWWFWDPVENFSILPWLGSLCLMHSILVPLRTQKLFLWNIFLAILLFILSVAGTFFVRSGLLTSVHSFVADPARGIFIFIFLLSLVGLPLYYTLKNRSTLFTTITNNFLQGKTYIILANNFLVLGYLIAILLGTIAPIIYTYFFNDQIIIGPSFFNLISVILVVPGIFWLNILPFSSWKRLNQFSIIAIFIFFCVIGIISYILVINNIFESFYTNTLGLFLLICSFFSLINIICIYIITRRFTGALFGHFGVFLLIISIVLSTYDQNSLECTLHIGDQVVLNNNIYTLRGINIIQGNNFSGIFGDFLIKDSLLDSSFYTAFPEHRLYQDHGIFIVKAAVNSNFFHDSYITFSGGNFEAGWATQISEKSNIMGLWFSAFVFIYAAFFVLKSIFFELKFIKI